MKLTAKLLVLLCAVLMAFALVSCGEDSKPSESQSAKESTSQSESATQQGEDKITITFYYGVKTFDEETGEVTEYAKSTVVDYVAGQQVTAPVGAALRTEGYRNMGWDDESYKGKLTKSIEVHQLYNALKKYNVTFKNADGSVIKTIVVYEGNKVDEDDIPDTIGYTTYTAEQYAEFTPETQALMQLVPDSTDVYMMIADADFVDEAIAVPMGSYFDRWAAAAGQGIGVVIKADATFTVTLLSADRVVPKVEKGSIKMDGTLDAGYASMGSTYQHPISMGYSTGLANATKTEGISDILNKYADFAAAEEDGKGEEWKTQYDNYHKMGDVKGTLYACWDGDYIYFYVQVEDSKVATNGKTYCSIQNPYENDAVEVWYWINGTYHKLCLDACGYHLWSMEGASQYLNHVINKGLYATKVYTDVNDNSTVVTISADNTAPRMVAEGENAGYVVEYALPAYDEPTVAISDTNPLGEEIGGANWGVKLTSGSMLRFALQVDCISAPCTVEMAEGMAAGTLEGGSLGKYLTRTNATPEDTALLDSMARWNAGWQMKSDAQFNTTTCLTIVLG